MLDPTIFLRQLTLINPRELSFPITIIGAGGIGSWATLALAKMGCSNITVIDFDKVEYKNTPSQLYTLNQKGQTKVKALASTIKKLTNIKINPICGKFQDNYNKVLDSEVIICGVDSLDERGSIWKKIIGQLPLKLQLYLDARMAGEFLRILTVNLSDPKSLEKYNKSITAKTAPYEEECTARSVVYNTFICGGLIACYVKKIAKKEPVKNNINFDLSTLEIF